MKKKVLLVCYHFPPNPGIGGRKWAFLAKYLLKNNIEVHVLTKLPKKNQGSLWEKESQGVIMHYFRTNYPGVLENFPKNIVEKIEYRLMLPLVRLFSKSNYYDRGVFLEQILTKNIDQIVRKNKIDNLIITGAPFSFLYYGSLYKKNNASINYIADIRDSWIKGNYFGFNGLPEKRKRVEIERLKSVLNSANKIYVPNPIMKEDYDVLGGNQSVEMLPHAVDKVYLYRRNLLFKEETELVNFGSQYEDLTGAMEKISKAILNSKINIAFYTQDTKYKDLFNKNNFNVRFHEPVNYGHVFKILQSANATLIFVNDNIKDYLSTKYIEAIGARIPIVLVGKRGFVSDYIQENKLGIFIDETDIEFLFPLVPELLNNLVYNDQFDIMPFTFEKQAEAIEHNLV